MNSPKLFPCCVCTKKFRTSEGARAHRADLHPLHCPECLECFISHAARNSHQQAEQHFQCARCHSVSTRSGPGGASPLPITRVISPANATVGTSLQKQKVTLPFCCSQCAKRFVNNAALLDHTRDKHLEPQRKLSPRCEDCTKEFRTAKGLEQHAQSTVHKPLANLQCVDGTCRLTFSSPSALIQHLEGGSCPSGWTRDKINAIVHKYDKDRILTSRTISLATAFSSLTVSTSTTTFSDLVILTPSGGSDFGEWTDVEEGQDEETMERSLILPTANPICPLCLGNGKKRRFDNPSALYAHLSSAAHAEKSFKCPVTFANGKSNSPGKQRRSFTTLSGLTQHLESGRCKGGTSTLWKTLEYLQNDVLQFAWPGKFLKH
ncbi:hypothetical protein BJY04DRAFT_224210 [Aspergillus karnatakaensis]|uniref:putative C2H2 finger domain protein n=1 Tax=Aspergillus karnatakaensis TaxID=1810916 RepID=UPI003CCD3D9A